MTDEQDVVDSAAVGSGITDKDSTDNMENASSSSINGGDGDHNNISALSSTPLVHNEDNATLQKSIVDENRNEPTPASVEDEGNTGNTLSSDNDNNSCDIPKVSSADDNDSCDVPRAPSEDNDDSFDVHRPSSDIDESDKVEDTNTENVQNEEQEYNKSEDSDDGDSGQNPTVVDNNHAQSAGNNKNKKKNKVDEISRETQRLIAGDGHVRLPYHKPKQKSLGDFLGRRRHLLADASVTGSRKQLRRAWEMIERKERNVHKFYNDDEVVDDQDSDDDNQKDNDQLDTLDKKPVVNKFMLSKSTHTSASVKLTCNDKDVLVSQSLSFKSFADDNGDEGLIVIDDSCKSDPKKRTIKKNLSSHSVARSHILKHDIWKRVRAAREAGLREVQSDDEDDEEYLLKDENKKSDYEDKAVMDEDEETFDDNEEEEGIDEEDLMDDDYSESKKIKKNKQNGFIDFECEVDSAEDVSDSSESDIDDNDADKNNIKKNPLDSSDSDSSTGIKTGVWKSLMSPETAGPVEDGWSSKKKRRAVVLSDSDDDDDTPGNLSEPTKLDIVPVFDTEVASTQQLFDLCSGKEFCTQQINSDAASVHNGSSDGFVSDVPGESDIEDSEDEDQPKGGGDSVGNDGIDDDNDGTDNENGNDDDGDLGDTESVQGENAKITDFFDDEAELSEDEEGAWNDEDDEEDEDAANEEDLKMIVNDNGEVDESIRDSLGKIYMRQMLDDDKRQVAELQEMLLEDGDLHNDMGRKRKFQWDDGGDEAGAYKRPLFSSSEGEDDDDDDDNDNGDNGKCEIDSEAAWRKERHIRDSYLATENDDEHDDDEVSQNLTALGTKKTHVIKYQANKTVVANTSVTKVLAEVAVVETTVIQNNDTFKPPDTVEVPTVEIGVNKINGPVAAVKGSFMVKKGSNSRAAAALMLVDSKKKAMGTSSDNNDGTTVKQLNAAKSSVANPFAYLLGGGGGRQNPIDGTSITEIKTTTTTVSSTASARPENLSRQTRPKKSSGLLKAFLQLE